MPRRVLPLLVFLVVACGDNGPDLEGQRRWRLTGANGLPLPAPGNATGGESWVAGILEFTGETGTFDRCMQPASSSDLFRRPMTFVVHPIAGDEIELSYFDRRGLEPDTASIKDGELTLRYRNVINGEVQGVDVLAFILQPGAPAEACSLVR